MSSDDRVLIFDTTLRDGEQSPGISLNGSEKLEIAHQLARLNVDIIEAGFPMASPGDFEAVKTIAQQVEGTVICDSAAATVLRQGRIDAVITGADRIAANGDAANKIGTYPLAVLARRHGVPFYVALPSSTFDWQMRDGLAEIPIEQRDATEVKYIDGLHDETITPVLLTPETSSAANYAFDVTPARLVTGLITERGVAAASREGLAGLFPEYATE